MSEEDCQGLSVPQTATLFCFVGTDTARNDTEPIGGETLGCRIKNKVLGRRIKEFEAQVMFPSTFLVKDKGLGRDQHITEANMWLRCCCQCEGFGFLDNGQIFQGGGLLSKDGIHLTRTGKNIFGHCLANRLRTALYSVPWKMVKKLLQPQCKQSRGERTRRTPIQRKGEKEGNKCVKNQIPTFGKQVTAGNIMP